MTSSRSAARTCRTHPAGRWARNGSGYAGMLADDLDRLEGRWEGVYRLALGGTAVEPESIRRPDSPRAAARIAALTGLRSSAAEQVHRQGLTMRWCSCRERCARRRVAHKIGNDIRLMSCGLAPVLPS